MSSQVAHRFAVVGLLVAAALATPALAQPKDDNAGESIAGSCADAPAELLEKARKAVKEAQDATALVGKKKASATDDLRDCLSPPHASLSTAESVLTGLLGQLQSDVSSGGNGQAVCRQVKVMQGRVQAFLAQAESCLQDGTTLAGNSSVSSNADALTDDADTESLLGDVVPDIDTPDVSPFE